VAVETVTRSNFSLDKLPAPPERYDPDEDELILTGCVPHTPAVYDSDDRCEACGFVRGDRISRSRRRIGRVVCSDCCRGSLDGRVRYPGLHVDERVNEEYIREYSADLGLEPDKPKYEPGTLKGGRGSKKKTKGGRGSRKKGVAK